MRGEPNFMIEMIRPPTEFKHAHHSNYFRSLNMPFIAEKDPGLIPKILSIILDECINGVTLADPDLEDMPVVYANKAFEKMTGYSNEDVVGRN